MTLPRHGVVAIDHRQRFEQVSAHVLDQPGEIIATISPKGYPTVQAQLMLIWDRPGECLQVREIGSRG
jgi:hypothetical protein